MYYIYTYIYEYIYMYMYTYIYMYMNIRKKVPDLGVWVFHMHVLFIYGHVYV